MAKVKVSVLDACGFTPALNKTGIFRQPTKDGYIQLTAAQLDFAKAGKVSHFEYDDEQGVDVTTTDGTVVKKYSLSAVDSASAKFDRLAGSSNLKISSIEELLSVNAAIKQYED